ncbi:coatomer subunit zeta-2 isoform X2 [Populus alba]|uniref:coatomer subunit zeta-2 isoform X2 n=1 Tax=Populus alba TaxID=43335 RepID=UPI003CC70BD3
MELCPCVKNILLLDFEGKRVASKYFCDDWPTNGAKEAFEKAVFNKTQKTNARSEGEEENEVILATVLQGFFDAVGLLLRDNVEKREALEYLDLILLCIDEIVDGGIILETDANVIVGKVASHSTVAEGLSEQTFSQALATAREHLARSLLK